MIFSTFYGTILRNLRFHINKINALPIRNRQNCLFMAGKCGTWVGRREIDDIYAVSIGYRKSYGCFGTFAPLGPLYHECKSFREPDASQGVIHAQRFVMSAESCVGQCIVPRCLVLPTLSRPARKRLYTSNTPRKGPDIKKMIGPDRPTPVTFVKSNYSGTPTPINSS